jgi:hypothetical protein
VAGGPQRESDADGAVVVRDQIRVHAPLNRLDEVLESAHPRRIGPQFGRSLGLGHHHQELVVLRVLETELDVSAASGAQ